MGEHNCTESPWRSSTDHTCRAHVPLIAQHAAVSSSAEETPVEGAAEMSQAEMAEAEMAEAARAEAAVARRGGPQLVALTVTHHASADVPV